MWQKALLIAVCMVLGVGGLARAEAPNQSAAMIVSSTELTLGFDRAMHDRLVSLGFDVRVVPDSEVTGDVFRIADADTYALLLVSESIGSTRADKLIGTRAPVMHNESYGWDNWRFTTPTNMHWATGTSVDIVNPAHPIATMAGVKMGSMPFFSTGASWTTESVGALAPGAEIIAQITDAGAPCAIVFAIEEGAQLANGSAALARSVGFSIPGNNSYGASTMTNEAWALFDAAVRWLAHLATPTTAKNPIPADIATDVPTNVVLSWAPGDFANTHDVYLGTSFEDVNTASRQDPKGVLVSEDQEDLAYESADPLEFATPYFWRIDEVNAAPDNTIFKGTVWSFTTEPYAYPLSNTSVIATASSSEKAEIGPQNTVNGSGLTDDLHSTATTAMWLSSAAGPEPAWIQYEFDRVYKLDELWVWNHNLDLESIVGYGFKDVAIECSLDGTTWTLLKETQFAQALAGKGYAHNTTVALEGVMARYVRLTAKSNWSSLGLKQRGLSEVRFFYVPVAARQPEPADGASDVAPDLVLNWRAGREAASHKVYLGTDQTAVAEGTAAAVTVTASSYPPAPLALDAMYFWRVDQVGATGEVAGDVWSFSTISYVVVDDFEGYNDQENAGTRIYETWVDGYGTTTNGSQVGNLEAPFAEKTLIHGGRQSMPLTCDNTGGKISEATRTFDVPQDWTQSGITTLVVHVRGVAANTGQLYVKINNTKISYRGNAADIATEAWTPWEIDLASSGASLASVSKLSIGIDGGGARGLLYVDDIQLK